MSLSGLTRQKKSLQIDFDGRAVLNEVLVKTKYIYTAFKFNSKTLSEVYNIFKPGEPTKIKERIRIKWWFDNWNGDVIKHNRQTDDSSCGVHVIEVKKIVFLLHK